MASDYVDDLLRDERESFKRKEAAAKKFDNRLDNFRKSAQALRDAARQLEEAFPGMSQRTAADKWAMTGTEKNIAFDSKGGLVAAPAGRKPTAAGPEPASDAAPDPETTGSDIQTADDETAPQNETDAGQDHSDDGRPSWASGNY
ncbi:gas vesicle protein [Bifidobacterium moukalabense]|uniref:gas vesicle protein n=1 Tax=Bifidobacterium moukalabense TaxID=1333651 RepID=UPI0010F8C7A4|nr:gas vesicle protein [Bifidobacterium moukalabense]